MVNPLDGGVIDRLQTQVYYPMVAQLRVIMSRLIGRLNKAFGKSDRTVSAKKVSVL